MGASQEIRFKIGGDTSSLATSFRRAESMAETAGRKMDGSFSKVGKTAAMKDLVDFRRQQAFKEADTVGKIKIVTQQLASLSYQRQKAEKGSTGEIRLQLDMERKRVQLRGLQKQAQTERVAGSGEKIEEVAAGAAGVGAIISRALAVVGGVAGIAGAVVGFFRRQVGYAQGTEGVTASNLAGVRGTIASIGGLRGQAEQGSKAADDMNRDIANQQNLVNGLTGGAVGKVNQFGNPFTKDEIDAQISKLNDMKSRLADIQQTTTLTTRELNRQVEIYNNDTDALEAIGILNDNGLATESKLLEVEKLRLKTMLEIEKKHGTPESQRATKLAISRNNVAAGNAQFDAYRRQIDVNAEFTDQAAQGRTFRNGARRPRSETERIADRAILNRNRARNAALVGADPSAFLARSRRDEQTVGDRLGRATANVPQPPWVRNLQEIKPELAKANSLLEAIKSSLLQVSVDVGK